MYHKNTNIQYMTLTDAVIRYQKDLDNSEYCSLVQVYDNTGKNILTCTELDDVFAHLSESQLSTFVRDYWSHDGVTKFFLL